MTTVTPATQYQHFVPQFLLRNFSRPYKSPDGRKRSKRKDENGLYFGESVVHALDFTADPPVICEKGVKRILGQINMYENATNASAATSKKEQRVEEMLSKLEDQAARVFRKITKAYEEIQLEHQQGKGPEKVGVVCLTRGERNLIRKFLFLLKYRGSTFHRRFYHQTPYDYNANDKKELREYMAENGYTRPVDVWFDNIKAIIDLDMDSENRWEMELCRRMYPSDAQWFFAHTQMFYMAICTPSDPDCEFILTDSSYNIFEGPNTCARNKDTGELEDSAWTELHMFAPISPKLMIVLRSFTFPQPLEDAVESFRQQREIHRRHIIDNIFGGEVKGLLHDLPVAKALNSYSQVIDGRSVANYDYDGTERKEHKFYFSLFPIGKRHVNIINGVLLDNCAHCTSVVFLTKSVFAKTLEWFLGTDSIAKVIAGVPAADSRAESFRKMVIVSRALGSTGLTITSELGPPTQARDEMHRLLQREQEVVRQWFRKVVIKGEEDPMQRTEFMQFYVKLGGNPFITLPEDLDQAARMWKLRVKIDVWSAGVAEPIRQRNRNLLEEAYRRLPPARFMVYAKFWRAKMLFRLGSEDGPGDGHDGPDTFAGPEDVVLRASGIFRYGAINRVVYNVVAVDIRRERNLWQDPWEGLTEDYKKGFEILDAIFYVTHDLGHIHKCGIPEVEALALEAQLQILTTDLLNSTAGHESTSFGILEDEQKVELLTRAFVKARFVEAMEGRVEGPEALRLRDILFNFAYPTPPAEWFNRDSSS
jgi:hypothetical protein